MKKKLVRITESDLRNMVRTSVNRILKEYHGEPDEYTTLVSTSILEGYQAEEIAEEYNLSVDEAAAEWFKGALDYDDFEENTVTSKREYITDIPELDAQMYYDYAADYYFLIRNANKGMIGFNEGIIKEDYPFSPDEDKFDKIERLNRIEQNIQDYWDYMNRAIRKKYPGKSQEWYEAMVDTFIDENTIREDLGGTSSFSVNSSAGSLSDPTGQQKNNIDVPFGKVQRRNIYSPKGDAKGDVTKQESNVDMTPAMKRKNGKGGSISIPKKRR